LIHVQGRALSAAELIELQELIDQHWEDWSRWRIAKELCLRWDWRTPLDQWKTFAARSLLLKLAEDYGLRLPPVREQNRRRPWGLGSTKAIMPAASAAPERIACTLEQLQPLHWSVGQYGSAERERSLAYLRQHHYLGCNRPVGTHLLYLVQDVQRRDLAIHLAGAPAWQCAARDRYIGWSDTARAAGLFRIGNHSRFLILPWVAVPQLASHILGELGRRIAEDWPAHHGWRLELLETFVEMGRFEGTAYRAANWQRVGETTGRTRQEKQHRAQSPPKAVWVYPLHGQFRQRLAPGNPGEQRRQP